MCFWAGLFADGDKETLIDGVNTMIQIATKLLAKPKMMKKEVNQIQDSDRQEGGRHGPAE